MSRKGLRALPIAPKIAEHFAHPEFKVFRSGERANALAWLRQNCAVRNRGHALDLAVAVANEPYGFD